MKNNPRAHIRTYIDKHATEDMSAVKLHSQRHFVVADTTYTLLCPTRYWFM